MESKGKEKGNGRGKGKKEEEATKILGLQTKAVVHLPWRQLGLLCTSYNFFTLQCRMAYNKLCDLIFMIT